MLIYHWLYFQEKCLNDKLVKALNKGAFDVTEYFKDKIRIS